MQVEVCILQLKSRVEPTRSLVLYQDYFYIFTIKNGIYLKLSDSQLSQILNLSPGIISLSKETQERLSLYISILDRNYECRVFGKKYFYHLNPNFCENKQSFLLPTENFFTEYFCLKLKKNIIWKNKFWF